ncbi:hypothetical protein AVDCRST_MAG84-7567 [uncultured Microcoleus sp.]|uniref:Uncharacterized protein n=1 Tax=uncultured Microcoleus sp. TaxID=259945 RepID=A0A6J4PYI6_9CYAN|nr:hypothetical protein AVDCRST_MAG84-7567 [uncultured Microcoleus sp.]
MEVSSGIYLRDKRFFNEPRRREEREVREKKGREEKCLQVLNQFRCRLLFSYLSFLSFALCSLRPLRLIKKWHKVFNAGFLGINAVKSIILILLLLVVLPGFSASAVCAYYLIPEWAALTASNQNYRAR